MGALPKVRIRLVQLYLGVVNQIRENLQAVQDDVAEACRSCGRDPSGVRLVAVSKTFSADVVVVAADCGQIDFGENRIQEARNKIPSVDRPGLRWHLIGHLQSNKVRQAVELFDLIQTVDSPRIARRLDHVCKEMGKVMPVLIEVNIAEESQKTGVTPVETAALLREIGELENLDPRGLMAIPPFSENPELTRPYFQRLAALRDRLNQDRLTPLQELSMGMSADYEVAIEEGATIVRVGTAIFGQRE
jgi:pyridoxal phosphate enzyme (YggS family)